MNTTTTVPSSTYTITSPHDPYNTITLSNDYSITNIDDFSNQSASIVLKGPNADIMIDGVSLKETLSGIQERLNILSVNPQIESKWAELKSLGEQYRKLEAEILEKERVWSELSGKKNVVK